MPETEKFEHFQVLRRPDGSLWELGRGAMGVTYKAFDTNLRCDVALKVINPQFLNSETARQRFLREARAAAQLRHPNVASVFHLGNVSDSFFYAMEYVEGETVEHRVEQEGSLDPSLAVRITRQVARLQVAVLSVRRTLPVQNNSKSEISISVPIFIPWERPYGLCLPGNRRSKDR